MRAVWSWLLELCELEREVGADEGAALLTGAGLEVEALERLGGAFSGVVVAEVVAAERHPKAERLTVVDVIDRAGGQATRVVCGAPNVPPPGGRVLWARPGARLPGPEGVIEIGSRALKGVESAGMLCSEKELGIGEDSSGIAVLAGDEARAPLGASAQDALGLADAVLEVSAPANRPDTLGHLGLARELCALVGGRLRSGEIDLAPVTDVEISAPRLVAIEIDDPEGCPRYVARIIDRLSVGRSPGWMRRRLQAVGVRPISNLVDVTNYVLFELGHPLHAFDYRHVTDGKIRVRRARAGERLTTLDGQDRALESGDLLICDARAPVALAGVMGGRDSEVADDTSRVLLEAAAFDALSVRRTARRLGLRSEAATRFERGVDPQGADRASRRAARLLAELGGGRVADGVVDAYPRPPEKAWIRLRPSRASALAGFAIERDAAAGALRRLGLEVQNDGAGAGRGVDELRVAAPSFRPDLTREVDLIEEVLRLQGYDQLPATLPPLAAPPAGHTDRRPEAVRRVLTGLGWNEAITYGFTSPARIRALGLADDDPRLQMVALRNPMTVDQSVMRTSLLPNLLAAVARNLKHDVSDVALFEVGSVFLPVQRNTDRHKVPSGRELPDEPRRLSGILCGRRPGWFGPGPEVDFFDAKGAIERVVDELLPAGDGETRGLRFEPVRSTPYLHPGVAARIFLADGTELGEVGEVHPRVRREFEITPPCFVFDLDLERLPDPEPRQMRAVPRFPAVTRDISLFVPAETPAGRVRDLVIERRDPLIEQVRVLEEYRDPERVPAGQKGLLWSITYRSSDRTLTDEEVDQRHEALVGQLVEKLAATRR